MDSDLALHYTEPRYQRKYCTQELLQYKFLNYVNDIMCAIYRNYVIFYTRYMVMNMHEYVLVMTF